MRRLQNIFVAAAYCQWISLERHAESELQPPRLVGGPTRRGQAKIAALTTTNVLPDSMFAAVIVTPGTTRPVGSLTLPLILDS